MTELGAETLKPPRDLEQARMALRAAGYRGEKVVIISDGRIVVEDTLVNLTREQRLDDAYKRAIAGGHREAVA